MHEPILARRRAAARPPSPRSPSGSVTPSHEVVYWVMGMRRYGHLIESIEADDDGFFSYGAGRTGPGSHPRGV